MAWIDKNLETYLQQQFPDRIVNGYYNKGTWQKNRYIQISTVLKEDMDIHYEYYQGHVELHLEGKYQTSDLINKLRTQTSDNPILSWIEWQGHENSRCRIKKNTDNWDEVVEAFQAMIEIFDPIIEKNIAFLPSLSNSIIHAEQNEERQSSEILAEVVPVRALIEEKCLRIPTYQRPYTWREKNVIQLLNDIDTYRRSGKSIYRIGSVILHKNKDGYDIVDGQQRLTTICMILKSLNTSILDKIGDHSLNYDTKSQRVEENTKTIQQWIEENLPDSEKVSFYKYLIGDKESNKGCQFVRIIVNEISEAFQMFDTQNGRGKELEAYNLLKAYHIRAMEQDSESVKVNCDRRWENATSYKSSNNRREYDDKKKDVLKYIFDETLYRSRKWSRREPAGRFSKKEIDEFKGFTIDKNHNVQFPFQNPQLLQYITSKFYESVLSGTIGTISRFKDGDPDNIDPFVNINQTLVNGKAFFDYVETYVEIYKRIFLELDSYQLRNFKKFYKDYCKDTHGRSGDLYLQNVYKSLIMILFDRFGEVGVEKFYKPLFFIIYKYRLSQQQVKYDGISKNSEILETFSDISQATNIINLNKIQITANKIRVNQKFYNVDIKAVVEEFKNNGLINETK